MRLIKRYRGELKETGIINKSAEYLDNLKNERRASKLHLAGELTSVVVTKMIDT